VHLGVKVAFVDPTGEGKALLRVTAFDDEQLPAD
jgi:hypothetical protein